MIFGPSPITNAKPFKIPRFRLTVFSLVMLVSLGIILARLVELTVIHGYENRRRADENRILVRPIRAPRGVILDAQGIALTRNVPVTRSVDFPGDDLGPVEIEEIGRAYPFAAAAAHVVGFVGEAGPNDRLAPGDIIGKTGLEKQYDRLLRGTDGARLIEVDANGQLIRIISEKPPISGRDIQTSLNIKLQQAAAAALADRPGAVVALDPAGGAVLALVSSPGFDPRDVAAALENDQNLPLFNRAVSGRYPPGSIFKLVTATAGLSDQKLEAGTTIEDTGEITIGAFRFGNWYFDQYGQTEGAINLIRAIARSNDIFFYRVGEWVGPDRLADWAKAFGLGSQTGIDIPGESKGLVPDPAWKERQIGERWFLGNTYHLAIGQGDVRLTPLQAAVMTAAAATGRRCRPRLVKNLTDPSSEAKRGVRTHSSEAESDCQDIPVSKDHRDLILQGMTQACSPGGTAFPFFNFSPQIACKTGTAQQGGEEDLPHAWVVVTGPVTKCKIQNEKCKIDENEYELDLDSEKKIVLAVLLEAAGEGSYQAAPVAKEILSQWFSNQ